MTRIAVDTSAAVPYLLASHPAHRGVRRFLRSRDPVLTAHSLAETYAVLTRLPADARLTASDAAAVIADNFGPALVMSPASAAGIVRTLARLGIVGGAVYDALVAIAALDSDVPLATRDARAAGTYAVLKVAVEIVPS